MRLFKLLTPVAFIFFSVFGFSNLAHATDRFVATTGADGANNCSNSASPCLTIQKAVDESSAADVIMIGEGTYDEAVLVTTDDLTLIGTSVSPMATITIGTGGINQSVLTIDGATGVTISNLGFLVDRRYAGEGVLCTNGCTRLTVEMSVFRHARTSLAPVSDYDRHNAISAGVEGSHPVPVEITVSGTTIGPNPMMAGPFTWSAFRAGIALDYGFGTIGGSTLAEANNIVSANHDIIVRQHQGGPLLIEGNTLRAYGVQYTTPLVSAGSVEILNNLFEPYTAPQAPTLAGDFSAMRLISNANEIPVNITGNTFAGHERGILIENFSGVTLDGNDFTPRDDSSTFQHIVLSNKVLFSNSTPPVPTSQSLSLMAVNNTFNSGSIDATGTAVELLNDNAQAPEPAGGYYGNIIFGTPGNENSFEGDFGFVFKLGSFTCADSNASPCPLASLYTLAVGSAVGTPVVPFAGNVNAINNLFEGVAPADMLQPAAEALLLRTQDAISDANLGRVYYGFSGGPSDVFVDDDYAGSVFGSTQSFTNTAITNPAVVYGVNAFDNLSDAIAIAEPNGTVYVAEGSYAESPVVGKPLNIVGNGSSTAATVINGSLTVTASGTDEFNPLQFSGFLISNAAGNGLTLTGTVSFLDFNGVAFENNAGYGVNFNGTGNSYIHFAGSGLDCRFMANSIGVRSSSTAVASNITFDNCDISNNTEAGIILFGASGSGTGQILDWSITDSRFIGNDNSDSTTFGGGIWIKTAGAGSVIDGFNVSNSTFEDNGSTKPLNQVGITLRARPGTTMANVSICNNVFVETATPGTQSYGILVFDDTGNNGYQPITICDNTFDGQLTGASGTEQHDARGTRPVAVLSGNITNNGAEERSFINDPVINLDTTEIFLTIGDAIAAPNTLDGHTIEAGNGVYTEAVVINHNNLTLQGRGRDNTVIGGTGISTSGVSVNNHTGVTIKDLSVADFTTLPSNGACIYAAGSNHITIDSVLVSNCQGGRAGIYVNGPVDGVVINNNEVTNVGAGGARGIVIWNGFKSNIDITNNYVHDMAGCCGIELQDGTASGVTATGNRVERVGDSGMAFVGLMAGSGPNVISGNTIVDTGRYGIEIKVPNGSGSDTGDGSIVIENNNVSLSDSFAVIKPTELRDIAGIAVIRRSYVLGNNNINIPTGVVVRNNTVSGYSQDNPASSSEGFGIVLEGLLMQATDNTVSNSDVGLQLQSGHLPYTADAAIDGDQSDLADSFFGRGNSPQTCAAVAGNIFDGNGADQRHIGGNLTDGVTNIDTGETFCSIQTAINDADTVDGNTISLAAGTYIENVIVNKSISLVGPFAGTHGADSARNGTGEALIAPATGTGIKFAAAGVVIDGLTITGGTVSGHAVSTQGANADNLILRNNRMVDIADGSGISSEPGTDCKADGFEISNNLFKNIGGGGAANGRGIRLGNGHCNVQIINNDFDSMANALHANGGNGTVQNLTITDNRAANTTSTAFVLTNTIRTLMQQNTVQASSGGLFISDKMTDFTASCNIFAANGNGVSAADFFTAPSTNVKIFHNSISGEGADLNNSMTQELVIGSNYYGGSAPVINGSAVNLFVADALPADPTNGGAFDVTACGDNTPTSVVAVEGSGQIGVVNGAFSITLTAQVLDALGGVVADKLLIFSAPATGATAHLSEPSGTTDHNGKLSVTAIANSVAGSYQVTANITDPSPPPPATFDLSHAADDFALFSIVSGNTQSGIAGQALDETLVVVAHDSFGNPVAGVPVDFVVAGGGGSIMGATTTTDVNGLASSGMWTLGADAGAHLVIASETGESDVPSLNFTATSTEQADIAIQKTSQQAEVEAGKTVNYEITVTNAGPSNATAVDVLDALPVELNAATASWQCVATGGANCALAAGTGDVSLISNPIPVGDTLNITIAATVVPGTADGVFTNSAMAELTSGIDPDANNDISDRDIEVITIPNGIFKDSFEDLP